MGSSNSQQTSKGSILIVDDSWEHLQALSATLSQYGYAVRGLKATLAQSQILPNANLPKMPYAKVQTEKEP
ncbi:hypothetical protein CEN45_06395 [Fischerella thermalis CCMEE 5198]|jgi:response regulator RpfG family c-di-GMP phosphodiesterase|uniref:response regulator n=1 Tax=Fischerella thermalis TaxID=372787 RepID=UPI000C803DD9|nr:response regulator [Fischerella thermalis]PLZ84936.1 hypothetical protein CI594_23475 [Fischerella thermalis CCMEE 5196]PMB25268.1 hypothetical protein CEN45_06395 [Fischerella thermalis CCMEE 5198]